jgi:hypothetical protein
MISPLVRKSKKIRNQKKFPKLLQKLGDEMMRKSVTVYGAYFIEQP